MEYMFIRTCFHLINVSGVLANVSSSRDEARDSSGIPTKVFIDRISPPPTHVLVHVRANTEEIGISLFDGYGRSSRQDCRYG